MPSDRSSPCGSDCAVADGGLRALAGRGVRAGGPRQIKSAASVGGWRHSELYACEPGFAILGGVVEGLGEDAATVQGVVNDLANRRHVRVNVHAVAGP